MKQKIWIMLCLFLLTSCTNSGTGDEVHGINNGETGISAKAAGADTSYTDWTGDQNGEAAEIEWAAPLIKYLVYTAYLKPEIVDELISGGETDLEDSKAAVAEQTRRLEAVDRYVEENNIKLPQKFLEEIRSFAYLEKEDHCIAELRLSSGDANGGDETVLYVSGPLLLQVGAASDYSDFLHMPNLTELILERASYAELTPLYSLEKLEAFTLNSRNMQDLAPLGQFTRVKRLTITEVYDDNFQFLQNMSQLEELTLSGQPDTLERLRGNLPDHVTRLDLSDNRIGDLSPLLTMTHLEELDLSGNCITDISVLGELTELRKLDISNNPITDLSPLDRLEKLEELKKDNLTSSEEQPVYSDWKGTPDDELLDIEWADPCVKTLIYSSYLNDVAEGPLLAQVDVGYMWNSPDIFWEYAALLDAYVEENNIKIPKSFLDRIRWFAVYINTDFVSVDIFFNDPALEENSVYFFPQTMAVGVKISSLEDFVHMQNLEMLWLFEIDSPELDPLLELPSLQRLGLNCANIRDLSVLGELSSVTDLTVSYLDGQDLSFLKKMNGLEKFSSFENKNFNLSELADCLPPTVVSLSLSSNELKDIAPLGKLTQLEDLSLGYNQISNVAPLRDLRNLKYLNLAYNQIEDIAPLAELKQLEDLDIESNLIADITAISELSELRNLNVNFNYVKDLSPIDQLQKLEVVYKQQNHEEDPGWELYS